MKEACEATRIVRVEFVRISLDRLNVHASL